MDPASIIKNPSGSASTLVQPVFSVRIMQATCAQLQQKERLEQGQSASKDNSLVIPATCMCWINSNILSNEDFDGLELRWHKTCCNFSSESKLQRLRKQCQTSTSIASTSCPFTSSTPKRRSCQAAIDWLLCMFCQAHNNIKVRRVETLEKTADVLERTATDPVMSIRLSGVCDLIAAEGCYNLTCLITFEKNQNQNQKCFYSILTKSIYKVTMKRFWIRGPLLRPAWSLT